MDAQGTSTQFKAIQHQVVGLSPGGRKRVAPSGCITAEILCIRCAERMVQGLVSVFIAVEFEHREIHDPEEVPLVVLPVGLDHAQLLGQVLAHAVEGLVHRGGVTRTEQQQRAGLGAGAAEQLFFLVVAEVVLDGADRVDLAAVAYADEGQSTGSRFLGFAEHIAARLDTHVGEGVIAAWNGDAFHRSSRFHSTAEHLESHVLHDVAHIVELHAVAGVRSVGAVPGHRVVPGHAREGAGQINSLHLLPDRADQRFVQLKDLLLIHEAHLNVQLGEFRLAIGPQILIAETARHLVVLLDATNHQQLLEQLG